MWAKLFGGLIAPVANGINAWQERKQEIKMAKHNLDVAIITNKARLAADLQSHNSNKEMEMLRVARPWMRWVIAGHIMALIDVAVIDPAYAKAVFNTLENIPTWIAGLFMTIFGFYFAVNTLTQTGGSLVAKWKDKQPS